MTQTFVKEQVRIIEEATRAASKSKESALQFLKDAGIIKKTTERKELQPHFKSKSAKKK